MIFILACTAGVNYICIFSLWELYRGEFALKHIALFFLALICAICTGIKMLNIPKLV